MATSNANAPVGPYYLGLVAPRPLPPPQYPGAVGMMSSGGATLQVFHPPVPRMETPDSEYRYGYDTPQQTTTSSRYMTPNLSRHESCVVLPLMGCDYGVSPVYSACSSSYGQHGMGAIPGTSPLNLSLQLLNCISPRSEARGRTPLSYEEMVRSFSEDCAALAGRWMDQNLKNSQAMEAELLKGRQLTVYHRFIGVSNPSQGPMPLAYLVERFVTQMQGDPSCAVIALGLLRRLLDSPEWKLGLTTRTQHRLILTCFLLAVKCHSDANMAMSYYSAVGCVSKEDLKAMELCVFQALGFDCAFSPDNFRMILIELQSEHQRKQLPSAFTPRPSRLPPPAAWDPLMPAMV